MLDLWIVRHGETDWNIEQRVQGWTDIPLNHNGRQQAQRLGFSLQGIPFRAIVSSDLERAHTTATILQSFVAAPVMVNASLRERRFGQQEGLPRREALQLFPNGAPDAETDAELSDRVHSVLASVRNQFAMCRVLCVSHGGWIRRALIEVGVEPPSHLHNTSLTRLCWRRSAWHVQAIDCISHLQ